LRRGNTKQHRSTVGYVGNANSLPPFATHGPAPIDPTEQKFFASFFQKRSAFFLPLLINYLH
jgi:hypothetical protein